MYILKSIRNIKWALLFFIFAFTLFLPFFLIADAFSSSQKIIIKVNKSENTISAHIFNADIAEIAKSLSEKAGIKVFLEDSVSCKITSEINNLPLEQGIKRLVQPFSTAFVFEKDEKNNVSEYQMKALKIFQSGNISDVKFREFDKKKISGSDKNPTKSIQNIAHKYMPGTLGAIKYKIMLERQKFENIQKKYTNERLQAHRKIAELQRKMSANPSPEQRKELVKKLGLAKSTLAKASESNSRKIIQIEKNIRALNREISVSEKRKNISDRQRIAAEQTQIKTQIYKNH